MSWVNKQQQQGVRSNPAGRQQHTRQPGPAPSSVDAGVRANSQKLLPSGVCGSRPIVMYAQYTHAAPSCCGVQIRLACVLRLHRTTAAQEPAGGARSPSVCLYNR